MALVHGHRVHSWKFGRQLRREGALAQRVREFDKHVQESTRLYAEAKKLSGDEKNKESADGCIIQAEFEKSKAATAGRDIFCTARNLGRLEEFKAFEKYSPPKKEKASEKNPNDMRSIIELDSLKATLKVMEEYSNEGA